MDDAQRVAVIVRELVGGVQPREHIGEDAYRHVHRHALSALDRARDEVREGVALHVLHDDVVALLARPDLEDGHDVGVVDPRGEARLLQEHLDELGLAREVRVQALDPDEALKAARAGEATEVHGRHPSGRELRDELETVEPSVLAFDGDELGAQGSGSRAKCMGLIMTSRGASEGPFDAGPTDPDDRRHARTARRVSHPSRGRRGPLGEEETDDRSGGCDTARDRDEDIRL